MKATNTKSPVAPRRLDTPELAAHLGVSTRTLAKWRAGGRIPFIRCTARSFRYDLAEVEAALRK